MRLYPEGSLCSSEAGSLAGFCIREGFFLPCCSLFLNAVRFSRCCAGGRRFRFPLTTGSGYHTFPGLSFNPWFDSFFPVEAGKGFRLPASTRKGFGRKCVPRALRSHRVRRLFASCAAAVQAGPFHCLARIQPEDVRFGFPVSPVRTAGRGGRPLTCN